MRPNPSDWEFDEEQRESPLQAHKSRRSRLKRRDGAARIDAWLVEPLTADVKKAIERLSRAPDVKRIAVMPDVHLAEGVCVGNVVATTRLIYPQAVGGDIGCGMTAVALDVTAAEIRRAANAQALLAALPRLVPAMRWPSLAAAPAILAGGSGSAELVAVGSPPLAQELSAACLGRAAARLGRVEFGTLGRGNHFLEFQEDEDGRCWVLVHSGSRHMGQAITRHHLGGAAATVGGLRYLDAASDAGRAYLSDADWARRYAAASRRRMLAAVGSWVWGAWRVRADWGTLIACDHNHVRRERHEAVDYWVHRKGAMPAAAGMPGIIPGSMGTMSVHVVGRGEALALCSSAHGAGRALARGAARGAISAAELERQMAGVWFDRRLAAALREEAPGAYKDLVEVLRAQRELTRVVRNLYPILVYKGT